MDTANSIISIQSLGAGVIRRGGGGPSQPREDSAKLAGEGVAVHAEETAGTARSVSPAEAFGQNDLFDKSGEKDKQPIVSAVKNINEFFQTVRRTLEFSLNEDTGRMVIQIKDAQTHEVIRQIPAEDVIQLSKRLDEFSGLLFREKA